MSRRPYRRAQIQAGLGPDHRGRAGTGKSTLTTWLAEDAGRCGASSAGYMGDKALLERFALGLETPRCSLDVTAPQPHVLCSQVKAECGLAS